MLLAVLSLCAVLAQEPAPEENQVPTLALTYLRNEGFLLGVGDDQVLIDGLYRSGVPQYGYLPQELRRQLESAEKPYDEIDLVLVSHFHPDHFHAESVGLHLQNNESAQLLSSEQVVSALTRGFSDFDAIRPRVRSVELKPGDDPITTKVGAIEVEMRRLTHGRGRESVENLGQIITIGGYRIMHFGDLGASPDEFLKEGLAELDLDIVLFPYWYFLNPQLHPALREGLKDPLLVAIHVPVADYADVAAKLKIHFPQAVLFEKPLDQARFTRNAEGRLHAIVD